MIVGAGAASGAVRLVAPRLFIRRVGDPKVANPVEVAGGHLVVSGCRADRDSRETKQEGADEAGTSMPDMQWTRTPPGGALPTAAIADAIRPR